MTLFAESLTMTRGETALIGKGPAQDATRAGPALAGTGPACCLESCHTLAVVDRAAPGQVTRAAIRRRGPVRA